MSIPEYSRLYETTKVHVIYNIVQNFDGNLSTENWELSTIGIQQMKSIAHK